MGESLVDVPKVENQIGEYSMDLGDVHGSVSFGRFETDSLCWEKWSAFPANRYLEEVEKCSTPGSVAQKKAYFEAHYKKIAARKAEQVDQDKRKDTDPVYLEDQIQVDSVTNNSLEETDDTKSDGHSNLDAVEIENVANNVNRDMDGRAIETAASKVDPQTEVTEVSDAFIVDPSNEFDTVCESEDLLPPAVDVKDVFSCSTSDTQLGKAENTVMVKEDAPSLGSQDIGVRPDDNASCSKLTPLSTNTQRVNMKGPKKSGKVTTLRNSTNIPSTRKQQSLPTVRSPVVSSPKPLKPALSKPVTSTIRPPAEKKNDLAAPTGQKTALAASKRVASPSLQMPLSPGPARSDPSSLATTRRSLILERMGDKDIVKRAFRTSQNNFGHVSSPSLAKSSPTYQLSGKETERKILASSTHRESNKGVNDPVKKMHSSLHGHQVTRRAPFCSGLSPRSVGSERSGTTVSSSFNTKHDGGANKLKRLSKKPGNKINAKEAERTLVNSKMAKPGDKINGKEAERSVLQSKIKMQKDAEVKKLQQSFNFKAKPLPAFYQASGAARSSAEKKGAKSEASG